MQKTRKILGLATGLAGAATFFAVPAAAAGATDAGVDPTPTFFVNASGGYSVYKSEMVQSNDTSTTVAYGFGAYAGQNRSVGLLFERESSAFTFALNDASLAVAWQDVHLRYRLGPVHAGVVVSSSTWLVKAPPDADGDGKLDADATPEDYIDIVTSGYGGNLGMQLPVGRRGSVYADLTFVTTGAVQQKAPDPAGSATVHKTTLGPRMDLELGGSLGLTKKVLDATCGFKYRTYNLSVDGTAYKEQMNTTYIGLMAGWVF